MAAGENVENLKFVKATITDRKVSERFAMAGIAIRNGFRPRCDRRLEEEARGVLQVKRAPAEDAGAPSKGE